MNLQFIVSVTKPVTSNIKSDILNAKKVDKEEQKEEIRIPQTQNPYEEQEEILPGRHLQIAERISEADQSDEASIEVVVSEKHSSVSDESVGGLAVDDDSVSGNSKSKTGLGEGPSPPENDDMQLSIGELHIDQPNAEFDHGEFFEFSSKDLHSFLHEDE